ncbi:ParB N-terminal domain-containing protein [Pseudonocardia sp. WMMC193]|uniref:ParB/RepB/Spo0J family partition protein n=1 Tax=Pseudonocardia sp. WMMC193 TaxID=2911965 RepID=UPI001F1578F6|nr:ParB N-terminal domain-containing protein [Pseudonocardia sp. WMMC193]MCF7547282.1 ParB N-terminal domain-containing protein [Pseudonocardia sp. WMMC193]MCF7547377.1 ParB N-terminal domain-containing protein [Pseudonocardia sp. WMMC193]
MAGKRVSLADLATADTQQFSRVPAGLAVTPPPSERVASLGDVAPNPVNARVSHLRDPASVGSLADSIARNGQLEPCTVVTSKAFTAIFPEHSEAIGTCRFVQVSGARRRAALKLLGRDSINVHVLDAVASSRASFVSAGAAENIDRENYDAIEEAHAVAMLVKEAGSRQAAAEQLDRTTTWITQRTNLLKLCDELQTAVRDARIPLRMVRQLHNVDTPAQLAALSRWQATAARRDQADQALLDGDGEKRASTVPRRSRTAAAVAKLGGTPEKIAAALRSELSADDRRELATALLRDDEAGSPT